ncbi:HEAT repeat domain-containing protein [Nostoc sp.]|uniref:HEAT repeat domain-containing protein n=1 Tax=Nostoc sp. TaxID=1180 RepID=UPI002FF7D4F0
MELSRIIVKDAVSLEQVNALAWSENWSLLDFNPRTETSPYNKIWITQDEQTGIHYIEDFLINIRYFLVEGKNQEQIIAKISSSIDTYDEKEIFEMAENAVNQDNYIRAIYHIAILARQTYNPKIFEIFNSAFTHADPEVRKAAILATVAIGWKEFRETLQGLQVNDPDLNVRERAHRTLQNLAKNNWKEE